MFTFLHPSPTLTAQEARRSLRMMIWEGVASGVMFSLGSGGFMAAYALALGANNLQVGVLAALPFITQVAQLPAILAVERFRKRKILGVPALYISQLLWIPVGAVPFLLDTPGSAAVAAVIGFMAIRGLFAPVWVTAWTSWMRDLVPREILGSYYGRRLAIMTGVVAVIGLGGSFFARWWQSANAPEDGIFAYSFLLIGGALTFGLLGPTQALRAREPLMPAASISNRSASSMLMEPLRDKNFSHLVRFLFVWSLTSNLAIPFFAVYMLSEIGLSLPVVIGFTVLGQATNILFVRVWGSMADRVGSKTVLSLSASLYLLVILGWIFTMYPERYVLTLPLLVILHAFAGVATAGVTLTVSTMALKVAPDDKATSFLGVAGIATNVGAGIGPIIGGLMADYFSVRSLRLDFSWVSPSQSFEFPAIALTGFDFLFAIAFLTGLLSLNLLVALREEGEVPRNIALAELAAHAAPMARAVSSVPGLGAVSAFSYGYLKRLPGADVALGVSAYELAAATRAAAASARRGQSLTHNIAHAVSTALGKAVEEMADVADNSIEVARHATRGALHVGEDISDQVDKLARGAVVGTLRAMASRESPMDQALHGAGYGVVQGAIEAGVDSGEAAIHAVKAARQMAPEMGVEADEAAALLTAGALEAAADSGEETLTLVREALHTESSRTETTGTPPVHDG